MKSYRFKYHIPRKDISFMNNKIETMWNTPDYKITFTRINKIYQSSSYKYICCINIKSILDIPIVNIKCTEIDIIKILDNFYYSLSNNIPTYCFFNNLDTSGNYNGIRLSINMSNFEYVYSITILQYNISEETINEICSIDFSSLSDISNFLDLMYITFLVNNVNISEYHIEDSLLYPEICQ